MLVVVVDVHERASGMAGRLERLGAQVDVRALTSGDYVVGPGTVVERKTVFDLHRTILAGRLWTQMQRIRKAGRDPYPVIEGRSIYQGAIRPSAVRGLCLAIQDLGVAIVRSEDADDTAAWLLQLAERRREGAVRDRPRYAQRPMSPRGSGSEAAVAAASGIGPTIARRILSRYGSIKSLAAADIDDLQAIPGVGIRRAEAIVSLIRDESLTDPSR